MVVEANIAASTAGGARFHVIGSQGRHGKDCQGQHKNEHKGDESFGFHDFFIVYSGALTIRHKKQNYISLLNYSTNHLECQCCTKNLYSKKYYSAILQIENCFIDCGHIRIGETSHQCRNSERLNLLTAGQAVTAWRSKMLSAKALLSPCSLQIYQHGKLTV